MRSWIGALIGVMALGGCSGEDSESEAADAGADTEEDASVVDAGDGTGDGDAGVTCTNLPETIDADLTVGPGCVRMTRSLVTEGATLTIAAGTTVYMGPSAVLDVATYNDGSALVAVGSAEAPILFTSESDTPQPGDWECVHIGGGSSATDIRYVTFEYGGEPCSYNGAANEGMLIVESAARAISNDTFRHSSSHGVNILPAGGVRAFADNAFADNAKPSLFVAAPQLLVLGENLSFADADDVIDVETGFSLHESGTLLGQPVPFHIPGNMEIDGAAEVTFAAGVDLRFAGGSLVVFNANLIVAGSAEAPVHFGSAQATPLAGDWGCITYSSVTGVPRIDHAVIEFAGNGMGCSGAVYETAIDAVDSLLITNTQFTNIAGSAVRAGVCDETAWCANTFEMVETGPLVCGLGTPENVACP